MAAWPGSGGNQNHIGILNGIAGANQANGGWDPFLEFDVRFESQWHATAGSTKLSPNPTIILSQKLPGHVDLANSEIQPDSVQDLKHRWNVIDQG